MDQPRDIKPDWWQKVYYSYGIDYLEAVSNGKIKFNLKIIVRATNFSCPLHDLDVKNTFPL